MGKTPGIGRVPRGDQILLTRCAKLSYTPRAMKNKTGKKTTTVGVVNDDVLAYTAGKDIELDLNLVAADCIGSAAHVTMLGLMPVRPPIFTPAQRKQIVAELGHIIKRHAAGRFEITIADQDVHLAVERTLTEKLGDLGKKVHTGRSRNDQVALDLRLYAKEQLLDAIDEASAVASALLRFAKTHERVPMVGRTHMQTAMPSSVGLWASSFAEGLLDDLDLLISAYELNDRSPLGSAASYGVPLPIDRQLVADLLDLAAPCHNVLYANNARGKMESIILSALSQAMLTLSRLAQDLMIFTMPEFGYFTLPSEFCTGSSIMPQKKNPDVLELLRAKTSAVHAAASAVFDLVKGLPSGYNRDLQEAKAFFMDGIATTRATLRIMTPLIDGMGVCEEKLLAGFTPDVFATDRALELVAKGMPFRDAYHHVKQHLEELQNMDPHQAIARKKHLGATGGLNFRILEGRVRNAAGFASGRRASYYKAVSSLLGITYPVATE